MSLKKKDKEYVWHPFDQMKGADIIPIVKGDGAYVFDENGEKYIDGFSSWWTNTHGHCNEYISEKIAEQAKTLEHIAFGGFTHPQAVRLSERLIKMLPSNIEKVFFSDNGSTANEVALKMAIQYWSNKNEPRNRFIALENDYHGDTFGSMSLTARGGFNEPFEQFMFDVDFVEISNSKEVVLAHFEVLLKSNEIAAFIFEPLVQGAAGMLMHSADLLSEMIQLCKKYEVLTIADEVFTGFGRTGKMFAIDHLESKPDIVCLSKGITGGFLPLGITVVSDSVYQAFYSDNKKHTFLHGHSYTGSPMACAAANAALDLFEEPETFENISRIASLQKNFVSQIVKNKNVREARCLGTIVAVEIDSGGESNYFNSSGKDAYKWFLEQGIILRPLGNVVVIVPPYCISDQDLQYIHEKIAEYLAL